MNTFVSLDSLFDAFHEDKLRFNPFEATAAGDHRYNDTMPNILAADYLAEIHAFYTRYIDAAEAFDKSTLSASGAMSLSLLEYDCRIRREGLELSMPYVASPIFNFPMNTLMPINQFFSIHLFMAQLAGGTSIQPFENSQDYYNWLKRVDDYLVLLDTAMANMHEGMDRGVVLPKVIIRRVVDQLDGFITPAVEDHVFYKPVLQFTESVPAQDRDAITNAYRGMVVEKLVPKYKVLQQFMTTDYLSAGSDSSGIGALPGGDEVYRYLVRFNTSTHKSPDELFDVGKSEVEGIRSEMVRVKNEVGFQGDLQAFFADLMTNPAVRPYTDPQQVIDHFNAIHERMKPKLLELFDVAPKAGFVVKRTEAFREGTASAEYQPGSKDGIRPGTFYVPIPDVRNYLNYSDESLFLHEAIPGHHYQLSLQQENEELPEFLHSEGMPAFVEGWALYCESLGKELGLYTDPYQYFGMLAAEMHRAIRLVVDVGMHHKGWSREEAIAYSKENEPQSEASIIAEIERYMVMPAQALAYKTGQLKILELRHRAEEVLGDRFDIKAFHDQVLGSGSLTLDLLEEKIEGWIADKKASQN